MAPLPLVLAPSVGRCYVWEPDMDTDVRDLDPRTASRGDGRAAIARPGPKAAASAELGEQAEHEELGEQGKQETTGRRRVVNKILLATTTAAIAGGVMTGVLATRNAALRGELADLTRWKVGVADSLRLARDYQNLIGEVFDLQQEVRARQTGRVPPLPDFRMQGKGIGALLGARVVPAHFRMVPDDTERELAKQEREPLRDLHVRLLVQQDVLESGALAPLTERGSWLQVEGGEHTGPTNTITFGPGVPPRDAVNLAYHLIASGILVRRIRQSTDPADRNTIRMSYARQVSDWPELTIGELKRFAAAPVEQ
jgi:hypothetical protein